MRIRHYLNRQNHSKKGEIFKEPSLTMPDMSMSVNEILIRFSQGKPLSLSQNLVYTEDEWTPDVRTMDLSQIQELQEQNTEYILRTQREIEEKRKLRNEAKKEQKTLQKVVEDIAKRNNETTQSSDNSDEKAQ